MKEMEHGEHMDLPVRKEDLKSFYITRQEALAPFKMTFTAEDFKSLELANISANFDSADSQLLFNKYTVYLRKAVEQFERGPDGLKRNLNEKNKLKVVGKEETDRMIFLVRKGFHQPLTKAENDEFEILYEQYESSLLQMARDAQARGLDCWMLPETNQSDNELNLPGGPAGLRRRTHGTP